MIKKITWIRPLMMILVIGLMLCGCGDKKDEKQDGFFLYYTQEGVNRLLDEEFLPQSEDTRTMEIEFWEAMRAKEMFENKIEVLSSTLDGSVLTVNYNGEYANLEKQKEVLLRAAVVKNLTQIEGIEYLRFQVEGEDLTNSKDIAIGLQNKDSFVENSGKEINSYLKSKIRLYFADSDGDNLEVEEKNVYYSSNVALERVVMEQLQAGPSAEGHHATIPADMKILGVSIADNVCYVNLDQSFISNRLASLDETIPIYSIANSLIENCHVDSVQISINGETNVEYSENINLNQLFHRQSDLIESE